MNEALEFIKSDAQRWIDRGECLYAKKKILLILNAIIVWNQSLAYLFWMRIIKSNPNRFLYLYARYKYRKISRKFGLQIDPLTNIGKGLYIFHGVGIIINGTAIIGENCTLSQFTTIGSLKGKAATIGDNVYIGPGVCIVEDVRIGNNVKIGAGAVVINDIPDNSTSVGNPNRIIKKC